MRLPYLSSYPNRSESVISKFLGLNQKLITSDGEFSSQKNISDRYYPAISSRKVRGKLGVTVASPHGLIYKNGLFYVDGTKCYYDGVQIDDLTVSDGEKKLVGMGAYVYIFPDNYRYNTYDGTVEQLGFDISFETPHWELSDNWVDMSEYGITVGTNAQSGGQITITETTTINSLVITSVQQIQNAINGLTVTNTSKLYNKGVKESGLYRVSINLLGPYTYQLWKSSGTSWNTLYESTEFNTLALLKSDMNNTIGITYTDITPYPYVFDTAISNITVTADATRTATLTNQTFTGASVNSATFISKVEKDGVYVFSYVISNTATFSPLSSGSTFMKISVTGSRGTKMMALINQSDNITISGCTDSALDGTHIVTEKGTDYIVISAVFTKYWTQTSSATLTKASTTTTIASEDVDMFAVNDVVIISGCTDASFNGQATVTAVADNSITVNKAITATTTQSKGLSISLASLTQSTGLQFSRNIPALDYVCENGNRLYGVDSSEHTVYASKLGDGRNWYNYENTASDAWYSSIGSDGDFTGCVAHMGYTLFMKENNIHVLYGAKPSNFSMTEKQLSGIKSGCDRSAVIINETLFYVGHDGVYAYDGSIPYKISEKLTEDITDAVGSQYNGRYFLSCKLNGVQSLLVYNPLTQIWNKEDSEEFKYSAFGEGVLFYINQNNKLTTISPSSYKKNNLVPASAKIDETTSDYVLNSSTFTTRLRTEYPSSKSGRYTVDGGARGGASSTLTISFNGATILSYNSNDDGDKATIGYWGLTDTSGLLGGTYSPVAIAYTKSSGGSIDLEGSRTETIEWEIESGDITESSLNEKHISRFKFNFELDKDTEVNIYLSTDDSEYEYKGSIISTRKTTYTVPIIPRRCNKYRYKLTGKGQFKLLGLSRTIEGGSELNGTVQYGQFR